MFNILISCIKGVYTVEVTGRFPERILNIASVSGIYLQNIRRKDDQTISFSVSKKAYEKLSCTQIEGITMKLADCYGFPVFFSKHKKRIVLLLLPILFIIVSSVFSLFVWKVEISGGDKTLQKEVRDTIFEKGVRVGALKHKINQNEVKRTSITQIDNLAWLWVDIRGTTAKVKIQERKPKPDIIPINEPSDVISLYSGIIEKIQVYCGIPLVKEGDAVEKGQLVVTGVFRSENENIPTYYHHATANIMVRFSEQKTVIIPKTTIKKTYTGNKKNVFGIKTKKNQINFSLNSRISYEEYDRIEKKYALPLIPVAFTKIQYREATVTHTETDIAKEIELRRKVFMDDLQRKNIELLDITETVEEKESSFKITFNADCRVRADKEIPLKNIPPDSEGENNGKNY